MSEHHTHKTCPTCGRIVPQEIFEEHTTIHGDATGIVPTGIFVKPKRLLGTPISGAYWRFYNIAESIVERFGLTRRIERAGIPISASGYAAVVTQYTAISCIPAVAGLIFAAVFWSWFPLALLASPLVTFIGLMSYLDFKADARRDSIENEMPILTTYLVMIVTAGSTVYDGLKRLLETPLLPASHQESRRVVRDTEIWTKDPASALEELARVHPSDRFATWINGLLYTDRVGGNISRFLENSSERSLSSLSAAWRRFSNFTMMMADVVVATFALLPLCLYVMVAGFVAIANIDLLVIYTIGISPMMVVIITVLIDKQSPKTPENYDRYYKIAIVTMVLGFVVALLTLFGFRASLQIALAAGAVAAFSVPAFIFEAHTRREATLEKALPEFLADLTESRRIGQALENTIVRMARRRRYGSALNKILGVLAWNATIGTPTGKATDIATRNVQSWYSRVTFFLFKVAATTGGGTVPVFERLAKFSRSYSDIRRRIWTQLQTHIAIFYATSIIVVYTVTQVISSTLVPQVELAQQLGGVSIPGISAPSAATVSSMTTIMMCGTVLNSIFLGLLAGKVSGGCLASGFKHVVFMVIITVASLIVAGVM